MLSYRSNTAAPFNLARKRYALARRDAEGRSIMLREFRAFIAKGNVLDLAVAVIIGAAFAKIATSLTEDVIMPVVGAIFGGLDFSSYFTLLGPVPEGYRGSMRDYAALKAAGAPVLGWGEFITVVINFLILAFIIFLLIRWASKMMRRREDAPGPSEIDLLTEIRDELRKR
jgi:large conductance mechanosensitive channel